MFQTQLQKKYIAIISTICVILGLFSTFILSSSPLQSSSAEVLGASNVPIFNPNYVLSNQTFASTRVFPSEQSVQNYLDSVNSPLRDYSDQGHRASYWIFAAARGQTSSNWGVTPQINPGVILAYLEKEQSLLSLQNYNVNTDPENRVKAAMGYGCPDTTNCDQNYYGFANQVNWAAYQLQFNYNRAATNSSLVAPYFVNRTVTTLDEYNIFLTNEATASNYRYTPHVYWGNYNLWKIIVANGWGVDTNSYSMADIDQANLANKDTAISLPTVPAISYDSIKASLAKNYNLGQTSDEIANVQQFLRQQGYFMNRQITGLFGTATQSALQNYNRDKGVVANIGGLSDSCKNLVNQSWTIGQEDDNVKLLQQCLRDVGAFNWPTNSGYFGPVTDNALKTVKKALESQQSVSPTPAPAPAPTNSGSTCQTLLASSVPNEERSDRVRQLQSCLRSLGYFTYPQGDTGYYGPVTQRAYQAYKNAQNSSSSAPSSTSGSTCDALRKAYIPFGETSSRVKQLQGCMRAIGLFTWAQGDTGYYGPATEAAHNNWYKNGGTSSGNSCDTLKNQQWTYGESSERVRQLQACMRSAGVFNWAQGNTGYFGDATKAALVAWRR